jgi:hypothetical protein
VAFEDKPGFIKCIETRIKEDGYALIRRHFGDFTVEEKDDILSRFPGFILTLDYRGCKSTTYRLEKAKRVAASAK